VKEPDKEICSALDEIGKAFEENELAYLAATSKIEFPFRDRLAFLLHKRYESKGCLVAREFKNPRIDMAVLNPGGQPICLIQLKAVYSFNAACYKYNYKDRKGKQRKDKEAFEAIMADDEFKMRQHAECKMRQHAAEHNYWLLLATHPDGSFESSYEPVVKYCEKINEALERYRTAAQVRAKAEENMRDLFNSRKVLHAGCVLGGEAFGRGGGRTFLVSKVFLRSSTHSGCYASSGRRDRVSPRLIPSRTERRP
jgi:hypothetical protein